MAVVAVEGPVFGGFLIVLIEILSWIPARAAPQGSLVAAVEVERTHGNHG